MSLLFLYFISILGVDFPRKLCYNTIAHLGSKTDVYRMQRQGAGRGVCPLSFFGYDVQQLLRNHLFSCFVPFPPLRPCPIFQRQNLHTSTCPKECI